MNLELVGFIVILASMGGCSAMMIFKDAAGPGIGLGFVGGLIGLVIFIAGRFQRGPGKG